MFFIWLLIGHCAMYDTTAGIVQTDNESRFTGIMENCTYYSNMFHGKRRSKIEKTLKRLNIHLIKYNTCTSMSRIHKIGVKSYDNVK